MPRAARRNGEFGFRRRWEGVFEKAIWLGGGVLNWSMDLDSLTPVDHARRYALLLASALGTFVFIALWMALEWNFFVAVLLGVGAGTLSFYPFRAVSRLLFPPPRRTVRRIRK